MNQSSFRRNLKEGFARLSAEKHKKIKPETFFPIFKPHYSFVPKTEMTLDCFILSILFFLYKIGSSAIKGHFCCVLLSNIILYTSLSSDSTVRVLRISSIPLFSHIGRISSFIHPGNRFGTFPSGGSVSFPVFFALCDLNYKAWCLIFQPVILNKLFHV